MNISAWSIKNPIPAIMMFIILTVVGLASFKSLGVDENPNIDVPIVTVAVTQPGAAPSELETQVTRKVEDAVAGLGNIRHIRSTVNEGVSATSIEFELGTSTDRALNDVRDAVSRIRQQLPGGINDPIIQRVDFVGGPLATYTVSSDRMTATELSWLVDDRIARALMSVRGVGQVQRAGGVEREIVIDLDPVRLESLGITADMVNAQVRALNIDLPGGRADIASGEQSIRTLGSAESLEALRNARISLPGGGWARLDTLGTVRDASAEPRQRALLNGEPVVAFNVIRSSGSSMVDVEHAVDDKLEQLKAQLPPDVHMEKIRTNAKFVKQSYHASFEHLLLGAGLAVLVIWLFLRDWRAAVISALAMPLSVIPTFWVMKWFGFTLNNMSLLGLALVVGILVDDAIVEIENIVRHIHMGKDPYDASLEAADEIGLAVVATTLTIIVVFVPVAFMGGIPGQFFKQFGITVAVSVFFSLLVARLITPMIAAYWMQEPPHEVGKSALMRAYDALLAWCLRHRFATVAGAVAFFVMSLWLFSSMPTNLIGNVDREELVLTVEAPPGTELEATEAAVKRVSALLKAQPEVVRVFGIIGTPTAASGPPGQSGGMGVNKGNLYAVLTPKGTRARSQQRMENDMREALAEIPGVRATFGVAHGLSGKLRLLFASNDSESLERAVKPIIEDMRRNPRLAEVYSGASLVRPEIRVLPDTAKAAEQGVSIASIARTAQIATMGDIDTNLAKFDLPDRQINIRVRIDPKFREHFDLVKNLKVSGRQGRLVPLSSVARVAFGTGPSQIDRYDRQRQITVEAALRPGLVLGDALKQVKSLASYRALPESVQELPTGDAEIQRDVFSGFANAMGAAVLLIYAVLVLLFHGFLQPLTIMMALPLSLGGALLGLLWTGQPMGLYALIGIVMLMGLATKNSILLVDYCIEAMRAGMPRAEAVQHSGEARMRPILMTTVAMIAGMMPIALGIGAGAEVRQPMAIAVVGGLITSTFLTLLVVPVVFTYVDDLKLFLQHRFQGRSRAGGRAAAALALALLLALTPPAAHAQPPPPVPSGTSASPGASPSAYVPPLDDPVVPPDVTLPAPGEVPSDVPHEPIDADEAARIALRHQASLDVARGQQEAASGRALAAGAPARPTVTVGGGYTDTLAATVGGGLLGGGGANPALGAVFGTGYTVNTQVRQLLYDFNRTRESVRQARALEEAAGHAVTRAEANLVLQVKQTFYALQQAKQTVTVTEQNVRNRMEQLDLARARYRAGVGLPADVARARTAVSQAIFTLTQARTAASTARMQLAVLMGLDPRTPLEPADSGEPAPALDGVEVMFDEALQRRPEMAEALSRVDAAQHGVSAAKRTSAPSVSATLSYNAQGATFYPDNNLLTAGMQMQWSPFDGGLTKGRVREAQGSLKVAQATVATTKQQVLQDVAKAYLDIRTAEQRLATAESEVETATESVRLVTGRYNAGLGTFLDVLDAQTALVQANINRVNAQASLEQARAALAYATGSLEVERP